MQATSETTITPLCLRTSTGDHAGNPLANPVIPLRLGVSVNEFCAAFGMGRTLFYRLVKEGRIKIVKAGRKTLIPSQELTDWLNRVSSSVLLGPAS